MRTIHVSPEHDLIAHETQGREALCVCGPACDVERRGSEFSFVIRHFALDASLQGTY